MLFPVITILVPSLDFKYTQNVFCSHSVAETLVGFKKMLSLLTGHKHEGGMQHVQMPRDKRAITWPIRRIEELWVEGSQDGGKMVLYGTQNQERSRRHP